jgi:hypothetical protein
MFNALKRWLRYAAIRQQGMPKQKEKEAARPRPREKRMPQAERPHDKPAHYIQPPRRFH